jgi:hypothetical protein
VGGGRTLELRQQIEEQQNGSECGLGSKEVLQTKAVGSEIVL